MNQTFNTSDFTLATALLSLGFSLEAINKEDPCRAVFLFSQTKQLDQAVKKYWSRELITEPQRFTFNQKLLKARIYQK